MPLRVTYARLGFPLMHEYRKVQCNDSLKLKKNASRYSDWHHVIDKSLIRCVPPSLPTCEIGDGSANIRQGTNGFHASILKGSKFFVCSSLPT